MPTLLRLSKLMLMIVFLEQRRLGISTLGTDTILLNTKPLMTQKAATATEDIARASWSRTGEAWQVLEVVKMTSFLSTLWNLLEFSQNYSGGICEESKVSAEQCRGEE